MGILQTFNVRSVGSIRHSLTQDPTPDRAGDQYPHAGSGYPSKHVNGAGEHPLPTPPGRRLPIYHQHLADYSVGSSQVSGYDYDEVHRLMFS